MKKFQGKYFLISLFGVAAFLALFIANGSTASYELPPRDEDNPIEIQSASVEVGTRLQLHGQFSESWPWDAMHWQDLWLVVQWQDYEGDDEWIDVDGWQGNFDEIEQGDNGWVATKEWWAGKEIMGSGPYRWLVYDHPGGDLLATSEPFNLSDQPGGLVEVSVELAP